ncbi:unnamed protein product [Parascedosporium putredinis]|uniref:GroES-like protein n=1 Tax=Parascedosporium putredinis TaxID=1442378 RepID=A0A9P1H4U3_9PEZI|nr:unnamed protein product [Parascedosporium putredinis]CAI7997073.1 unnamed protein product [Parascedosporium putredinis]
MNNKESHPQIPQVFHSLTTPDAAATTSYRKTTPTRKRFIPRQHRRQQATSDLSRKLTMKAVNYVGPHKVKVEEVEKPRLEHPDDVIVKVTTAAICGSDLQ